MAKARVSFGGMIAGRASRRLTLAEVAIKNQRQYSDHRHQTDNQNQQHRSPKTRAAASTAVFTVRSSFSYMRTPRIPRGTQCARTRKRAGGELVRWGRRSGVGEFTKVARATPFSGASMPNEPSRTDHRIEINEGSLKKNLNAPPTNQRPPPPRPQTAPPPQWHSMEQ
jgi:hypothetical protein